MNDTEMTLQEVMEKGVKFLNPEDAIYNELVCFGILSMLCNNEYIYEIERTCDYTYDSDEGGIYGYAEHTLTVGPFTFELLEESNRYPSSWSLPDVVLSLKNEALRKEIEDTLKELFVFTDWDVFWMESTYYEGDEPDWYKEDE